MKYDDLSLKEDPIFLTLRRNMHVLSFSINFLHIVIDTKYQGL